MAATIKDVAKMADVSISTVSRVINESKPVSPEARRRVLHAIEVLDYKPNEVARSLVTKKSNLIGVIVEDVGRTYVSRVLRGVEEVGRIYNYDILLTSSYGDLEAEIKFAKLYLQKQVEGIIVISNDLNPKLEYKLEDSKIPYIFLNLFYKNDQNYVNIDYERAIYEMTRHLIELGHKKIASVAVKKDLDRTNEVLKLEGYKKAMEELGEDTTELFVESTSEESMKKIEKEIISAVRKKEITAVVTTHDLLAIHLINLFLDNEIYVPKDISVTGFGGSQMGEIYRPKLTTVKIPYYDLGAVAIRKILKDIEEKKRDNKKVLLTTQITEGKSAAKI